MFLCEFINQQNSWGIFQGLIQDALEIYVFKQRLQNNLEPRELFRRMLTSNNPFFKQRIPHLTVYDSILNLK